MSRHNTPSYEIRVHTCLKEVDRVEQFYNASHEGGMNHTDFGKIIGQIVDDALGAVLLSPEYVVEVYPIHSAPGIVFQMDSTKRQMKC